MTKKDYELIAGAVARSRMASDIESGRCDPRRLATDSALRLVALDLAATLADENPRFDRDRFLEACGVRGL